MVEVRKREKESAGSLLRRFSYKVKKSGILVKAKEKQFQNPEKTKMERRSSALRKLSVRKTLDMQKKLGELKEYKKRR